MKKNFLLLLLAVAALVASAQQSVADSLKRELARAQTDSAKFKLLQGLASYYQDLRQDSLMFYVDQAIEVSNRNDDDRMRAAVYSMRGQREYISGNYPIALQLLFKSLQLGEATNDSNRISAANNLIGTAYKEYDAPEKSLSFYRRSAAIAELIGNPVRCMFAYGNLAEVFTTLNMLDSAMLYQHRAYTLALKLNSAWIGYEFFILANIQLKLHNKGLALEYYRLAIDDTKHKMGYSRLLSKSYLALANFYSASAVYDSAIYYARRSMEISEEIPYLKGISASAKFLSLQYDSLHHYDSTLYYLKIFVATNDSLNSRNSTAEVENLGLLEHVRQRENELALQMQREEEKQNIEYALLALGIVSFIILFLVLSRSFITNAKAIEFFSVIALLLVFEFLNLLLHPFLGKITHHSPVLMLLALVCIAALLVPLHHRLEKWATEKLVEKNKAIRLAQAKKTIQELENDNTKA